MSTEAQQHVLLSICGNQNAGKSGLANVLAHSFGCTPVLNAPVPTPTNLDEDAAALQFIPVAGPLDGVTSEQLVEASYSQFVLTEPPGGSPGTPGVPPAAPGSNPAQPRGAAPSSAVRYSKRRGLFTIEDDNDHATWLTQCVHFEPPGQEVSFVITYKSKQEVLAALQAAHAVLDKAGRTAKQHGDGDFWDVLHDRQRCISAALRYTGWPSDGLNALRRHISTQHGGVPITPDSMLSELRSALRLSRAQWEALGHTVSVPLPPEVVNADGRAQGCSYGEALKVLQAQHAWVMMADADPAMWQGNRYLGLISHLDITIPAPSAPCSITVRDGQGQEVSTTTAAAAAAAAAYGSGQQQQQLAAVMAGDAGGGSSSWQRLEALGVTADTVYVVKEANASGLASLQQAITPEMKSAWVQLTAGAEAGSDTGHTDDANTLPVLMVGVMVEKIHPDMFALVSLYNMAKEHGTPDRIASRLQQLQSQVAEYMSGEAGRQTTAMLRQHVSRNLAAALVSVQGVQPGQEHAVAQRILDAGGVVIQPLFPWLWAGGEVAAHMSLKGISTGELLTGQQSGLQALHDLMLRRAPSQQTPSEALQQRAAAAQQHLHELLCQQQIGAAALSTLPDSAQGLVEAALQSFQEQAAVLVQQQADKLDSTTIPAVKAEVPVFWQQVLSASGLANTPERVGRRLLIEMFPELQLQQVTAPIAAAAAGQGVQAGALSRLVQQAKATGADVHSVPERLCQLLKGELPANRGVPELLFVALLEDRLPRKACLPPDLDLPPELSQLQQLQAAIHSAQQHPQSNPRTSGQTDSMQQPDQPEPDACEQPLLMTFQQETCRQLVHLAAAAASEAAAKALQGLQHTPAAAAAAAAGSSKGDSDSSLAVEVEKVVLQACMAWIDDLAVRLAHYTCRYLFDVLAWQSGWALRQVYESSGLSHALLDRLSDIGSTLREAGRAAPGDGTTRLELFERFVLGAGSPAAPPTPAGAAAGSSAAKGAASRHSQLLQQHPHSVLSWLTARLAEGLSRACCGALDDLCSGLQQELVNWAGSIKSRADQVSTAPTTTATEAAWQQVFCAAFTAATFEKAAQQQAGSRRLSTPPAAPATPGTSRYPAAASPAAAAAGAGSSRSSSRSTAAPLRRLQKVLRKGPVKQLLQELTPHYAALLSGSQAPAGAASSSASSLQAPAAVWQQQLGLFEQAVGLAGHKVSLVLGGVPQAQKLLETVAVKHSAQLSSWECGQGAQQAASKRKKRSKAADDAGEDITIQLPAADVVTGADNLAAVAAAAAAAAAGGGGSSSITFQVQPGHAEAWMEALLVGVFGQLTPLQLGNHLANLPAAPPLAPPGTTKAPVFERQRTRSILEHLWGGAELSQLVEAFMPRQRRKQERLRNAHALFLPPTGDISTDTCTQATKFYNEVVRAKFSLDKAIVWNSTPHPFKTVPGRLAVGWYRSTSGDGIEYFRLLGSVTEQVPTAEAEAYLRSVGALPAAMEAEAGAGEGAAAGAGAAAETAAAGARGGSAAMPPTPAKAAAAGGAAPAAAATPAAATEAAGAGAAAAAPDAVAAAAGGAAGGEKRYWRVVFDNGEEDVCDDEEVDDMALPIKATRCFPAVQRAALAAAGLQEPRGTRVFRMGASSVLAAWSPPDRLVGPYGKLRSRQEVQAVLHKLQEELAAADKPMLEGGWVRNVGPARYFTPLQGLSSSWMWREVLFPNTGRVQPYWRFEGSGWNKQCNSKPSAALWEDGMLAASVHQQQLLQNVSPVAVDGGPQEVRSNSTHWRRSSEGSTYYFDALHKLQAPGVRVWRDTWARHNGRDAAPVLRLAGIAAAAEFVRDGRIAFNSSQVRLVHRVPRGAAGYGVADSMDDEEMEALLDYEPREGPQRKRSKTG